MKPAGPGQRLRTGEHDVQPIVSPSVSLLLPLSLACDAAGQLSFKKAALRGGSEHSRWFDHWLGLARDRWIWAGLAFFALEFFLWLAVLSLVPLSRGVLLGSASTLVMLLAGRIFFREHMGPLQVLGATLIAAGVAVVGLN